jgi:hypothetical protein
MNDGGYRSFFEGYLYSILGGESETERERLFRAFLADAVLPCSNCAQEFPVRSQDVCEDDEVLCERCRKQNLKGDRR